MTDSAVTGGGLLAAANFGVLMQMNQYQSATAIAKMREAYGLGDNDLPVMADMMQKARYAYGIQPDDFRAVAQYAAPTYNTLKLTGADNAKKLLAVQGMAASVGLENTSFGTNFAAMLGRTAQIDFRLGGKGQEAKEAREALSAHGLKLNFFDAQGKFAGIENMFGELDKLKPLKDIDRMHVLHALFGVEAARPASIMIEKGGLAAYKESLARLDSQASMTERLATKTSTLRAKEEALAGTWENVKATAGQGYGGLRKNAADAANESLGWVQGKVDAQPGWGSAAITGVAGVTGAAATYGTLKALQSVMGTGAGARVVSSIPGITTAAKAMSKLPVAPKGPGIAGLAAATGGALLSTIYGEESKAARYGSAALSGAGLGATIGSMVPVLGTALGAAVGGVGGLLAQAIAEMRKPPPQQQAAMKADITVNLAPGLVLQQQRVQTSGGGQVTMNTGNIRSGAPW
jgi:TP901 family phage tail tape measure protein